jgi:hypothetical protein
MFTSYLKNMVNSFEGCHSFNRDNCVIKKRSQSLTFYSPLTAHLWANSVECARKVLGSGFLTLTSVFIMILSLLF